MSQFRPLLCATADVARMDGIAEVGDEADSPIIVPPPNQILRRAARTKIRKPGLPGDGGGHRFGASTRRGRSAAASGALLKKRLSDASSSNEHGEDTDPVHRRPFSSELPRPESYSDKSAIYDAYAREGDGDEDEEETPTQLNT